MNPTMIAVDAVLGTAEVAAVLECPKQQIYALRNGSTFPKPIRTIAATPLWDLNEILAFKASWKRRAPKVVAVPEEQV